MFIALKQELKGYRNTSLRWSAALFVVLLLAIIVAWALKLAVVMALLVGGLIGATLATINLFALGYAFYVVAIKKGSRWTILCPVSTFIFMAFIVFAGARLKPDYLLGFAAGLTVPVLFATAVIRLC